jgi:ribosomal protein S18 acetylase RimI-like enzyme
VLEEILQGVRHDLVRREEAPSGAWVEETARELVGGAKAGWYYPEDLGGGIAFYTRRGREAYGHVDAGPGADPVPRAARLAEAMLDALPADVLSINLGFTSVDPAAERALTARLALRSGSTVIDRLSLERPLSAADGAAVSLPSDLRLVPIRDITVEALADLDQRSFRGSIDELLVGTRPEEYREVLGSILEGRLGRFVDEASIALVERAPVRLIGAALTAEQTIRRAILVDLMIDPERRRRGIGRDLLRWVLRALWALGYESVRLWVTAANAPARGLYAAFGFQAIGAATIYRWERPPAAPQPQSSR